MTDHLVPVDILSRLSAKGFLLPLAASFSLLLIRVNNTACLRTVVYLRVSVGWFWLILVLSVDVHGYYHARMFALTKH